MDAKIFYTLKEINPFGVGVVERSGRRMRLNKYDDPSKQGTKFQCAVCKEYKTEVVKFTTYKGDVSMCLDCKPRAEMVRGMLYRAERHV